MIEEIKSKLGQFKIVRDLVDAIAVKVTPIFCIDIETANQPGSKTPADSPHCSLHGIAGIAIANMYGDSMYIVINDKRDLGGVPLADAIRFLNNVWTHSASSIVFHNSKFDLGFLLARGLRLNKAKIIDTWLINSMRCAGVFTSNKLKEIVTAQFGVTTDSKNEVDEWLAANGTMDYGDIPPDLLGRYACQDVMYTMMLLFGQPALTPEEQNNHDLYVRNTLNINAAEERGLCVNVDNLTRTIQGATARREQYRKEVVRWLGAAVLDVDNEQEMLKYLHSKNLHGEPRESYGELKFVFDGDFLAACSANELAKNYLEFHRSAAFVHAFSGKSGAMGARIFKNGPDCGFNTYMQMSVFTRGGLIEMRAPDLKDRVALTNEIRALFAPRSGSKFVLLSIDYLRQMLIAHYSSDAALLLGISSGKDPAELMAERTKLTPVACRVLWRKLCEGSGNAILERRLKQAGVKVPDKKHFEMKDKFEQAIFGFLTMTGNVNTSLASESGGMRDKLQRVLTVPEDKRYRSYAVLVNSSYGSLLSFYLDIFCRVAAATEASLVLAHENEFLFECPKESTAFEDACHDVAARRLIDPNPLIRITTGQLWRNIE